MNRISAFRTVFPGLALCVAVALLAAMLQVLGQLVLGQSWLEALVIAILLGSLLRTLWALPDTWAPGIRCAAKGVLELAIALLGATISFGAIADAGLPLLLAIVVTVSGAIAGSYVLGRAMGLSSRMAMLVACGNAICGNSAIAAIAPVIRAESEDVAASIAFTAVLGIVVVLALPLVAGLLDLGPVAGGILAGLTVYAVPQVLAAAGPMGGMAVQVGTLVKLVRVLMLGPIVAGLSLLMIGRKNAESHAGDLARGSLVRLVPPFIVAFLALASVRSLGLMPEQAAHVAHTASGGLTVIAMAGLGLGVDVRSIWAAGPRSVFVVTASLLLLGTLAYAAMRLTGLA